MQKFIRSGGAFMVVAILCMVAGLLSENSGVFISIGGFWLVVAIIVRAKNAKKPLGDERDNGS